MPLLGLDYAGGRPGGAAIWAAGYRFVVRYLTPGGTGLPGKLLTQAEYADLLAHGIAIVCNWETTATRMRGGAAAGQADAQSALAVMNSLGHPADRPVYFSADWDATPADQVPIDAYLNAAAAVLGGSRVGVYGGYYVVKRCLDNGTARWAWQTGAWSPSAPASEKPDLHQIDPRAHIYQRVNSTATVAGVACDVNEALQADFGQNPGGDDVSATDVWFGVPIKNYLGQNVHAADILSATEGRAADLQAKADHITLRIDETANAIVAFHQAVMASLAAIKAELDTMPAALEPSAQESYSEEIK